MAEYKKAAARDDAGAVGAWVHARRVAEGRDPAPSTRYVPAERMLVRADAVHRFVWGRSAVFYVLCMRRGEKYVGVIRFAHVDRRIATAAPDEIDLLVARATALVATVA